jgi:hypothetical protein
MSGDIKSGGGFKGQYLLIAAGLLMVVFGLACCSGRM